MKRPLMTTPQEWAAADRRIAIVLMRQAGCSFASIGRDLGISGKVAGLLYRKAIVSRVARWRWFERVMAFNERLRAHDTR